MLRDLLASADRKLVLLIRRKMPELASKEIADSILRLDAHVEPPRAWNAALQPERKPAQEERSDIPKKKGRKIKRVGVSLREMIEAGLLPASLRLFRKYRKQMIEAKLHEDGTVEFQSERFRTCSTAAEKAGSEYLAKSPRSGE